MQLFLQLQCPFSTSSIVAFQKILLYFIYVEETHIILSGDEMGYKIIHKDKEIHIIIDTKNDGKLRFKKRSSIFDFGQVFSTRETPFNKDSYLEWQIGYDIPAKEVKEETAAYFGHRTFMGRAGKTKFPFELFEIYLGLVKRKIIQNSITTALYEEILSYKNFLDGDPISVSTPYDFSINNVEFKKTSTNLPTYYYFNRDDGTIIEVSIKQQQYASGTQPMVYFCIPIFSFLDGQDMIGKTSFNKESLSYVIGTDNSLSISNLIKIFGMASKKHHYDILSILDLIRQL